MIDKERELTIDVIIANNLIFFFWVLFIYVHHNDCQ